MKIKQLLYALLITAFSVLIVQMISGISFINAIEMQSYDYRMKFHGNKAVNDSIVIVAIGDQSYEAMNHQFPWPRNWHGELVRNLKEAQAKLIIFDIQFDAENPLDTAFAEAIKDAGNVILVGKAEEETNQFKTNIGSTAIPPNELLLRNAYSWALVGLNPDDDGVYRRYNLGNRLIDNDSEKGYVVHPTLAVEAFKYIKGLPKETPLIHHEEDHYFSLGNYTFPVVTRVEYVNSNISFLINFAGGRNTYKWYSYETVIDDENFDLHEDFDLDTFDDPGDAEAGIPPGLLHSGVFKDKIVLVGATFAEQDTKATPYTSSGVLTPGVELHANALQTVLNGSYYQYLDGKYNLLISICLALLIFLCAQFLSTLKSILCTTFITIGYVFLSFYLYKNHIVLEFATPIMIIGFTFTANYVYNYILSYKEKTQIKSAFGHYVPPAVVNELLDNPNMLHLGGEEREMTVMFSDVAGFTTISENLSPKELVELLNEYLTAMTDLVLKNNGIIDKYEGDAIMAEWGAPLPSDDHALMACKTAIEMQQVLKQMRPKWAAKGLPPLEARIGINTGEMVVGNMGSRDVFDYTVMGDNVNLASRLEGANKPYKTFIMISEATLSQVKDHIRARELDYIRVKGKTQPIQVFEIIGFLSDTLSESEKACLLHYDIGLRYYREQVFDKALIEFNKALEANSEDGPSQLYKERCTHFIEHPPEPHWDGVFTMTTK